MSKFIALQVSYIFVKIIHKYTFCKHSYIPVTFEIFLMIVCETKRLLIRHFRINDTEYILKQLNEKSFIQFIADKKIRNHSDAEKYLKNGAIASYTRLGFGLNMVLLKDSNIPIGMCGLVKREELRYPDLGFAFLPQFWGKGYALESSKSVIDNAVHSHSLDTVMGVTLPDNQPSNSLLMKLGFNLSGMIELYGKQNNLYEYRANL